MYYWEVTINKDRFNEFIDIAKDLEVKGLKELINDDENTVKYSVEVNDDQTRSESSMDEDDDENEDEIVNSDADEEEDENEKDTKNDDNAEIFNSEADNVDKTIQEYKSDQKCC